MFLETVFVKLQLIVTAVIAAVGTPAASAAPTTLCSLQDSRITESSGVAVDGDVLWTHNDSGDRARFFALDRRCRTLATYNLSNETATDWEDMARGAGALWFGDIGDNASTRSEIAIVRVPEPHVSKGTHTLRGTVYRFRYADGAHDAETLLVHPKTGQLFVVTKTYYGIATVYAAPLHPAAAALNTLTKVGDIQTRLTGTAGDINAQADRVVVRTYTDAYEWVVAGGDVAKAFAGTPTVTPLPETSQGEAIAYDTDGRSWITTSEGTGSPVHRIGRS